MRFSPEDIVKLAAIGDVVLIWFVAAVSALLYKWLLPGISLKALGLVGISTIFAINFAVVNGGRKNYRLKRLQREGLQLREVLVIWAVTCGLLAIVGFSMKVSTEYSRGAAGLFLFATLIALCLWRIVISRFISRTIALDAFAKKRVIVIAEQHQALSPQLHEMKRHGLVPVMICGLNEVEMSSMGASSTLRLKLTNVSELARRERVDGIYVMIGWNYHRVIDVIQNSLTTLALPLYLLPDESASRFLRAPMVEIGNTWAVPIKRLALTPFELATKRIFDIAGALLGLAMLAPLLLATALLIKIDSRGPVFFRQRRNGFNGHEFRIFKFRTMHVCEDDGEVRQAVFGDSRVTRVGRILRRTSIDEIPQLINVLMGEMSLVGPRPHACSHDSKYSKLIATYAFRHHVKPGLTGWAQVNGYRGETPRVELMERRVEHDLWYINHWSLMLDIRISLMTLAVGLSQQAAY